MKRDEKPERKRPVRKRRGLFVTILVVAGLYFGLQLVLGSSPVQRRVVSVIQETLAQFGFSLVVESIEFSAFSAKIYLNRVTLSSTKKAEIQLKVPLKIDKIKIQFQPLALLQKKIVIKEAVLFNPKVILPNADKLYHKLKRIYDEKRRVEFEGAEYTLVIKRVGIVDASFNVVSKEPQFSIQSSSLTVFLENGDPEERGITLKSVGLRIQRKKTDLLLSSTDVDAVLKEGQLRLNRALVEGEGFSINIEGVSSLPLKRKNGIGPESVDGSYDIQIPLALLSQFPELKMPLLEGIVTSSGSVRVVDGVYSGKGEVEYEGVKVDGYDIGAGTLAYSLLKTKMMVHNLALEYGQGKILSNNLRFELTDPVTFQGNLALRGVNLDGILESVRAPEAPVHLGFDGTLEVIGRFSEPFQIDVELSARISDFAVLDDEAKTKTKENVIIGFDKGRVDGKLTFLADRMEFQTDFKILGGNLEAVGYLGYDNRASLKAEGKKLSLTQLGSIADIAFEGDVDLRADLDVVGSDLSIDGSLEITEGEISSIFLGDVTGQVHFRNNLLSFEGLEILTKLEPVRGSGFVDFVPAKTHYKFDVSARRLEVDRALEIFRNQKLGFSVPKGGELATKVYIEGGHDKKGIEVKATGSGRYFRWYDESWNTSKFFITYRPDVTLLNHVILRKPNGALEIDGRFDGKGGSRLSFISRGLRLEELEHIDKAPLAATIEGQVELSGDMQRPALSGDILLSQTTYRGQPLPDSTFRIRPEGKSSEVLATIGGGKLRGRWVRSLNGRDHWELLLYFKEFDFIPVIGVLMGKDVPTFTEVRATGDFKLEGGSEGWKSVKGSGTVNKMNLGLRGTPMQNTQPIEVKIDDGLIKIDRFHLVGRDSQVSFDLIYHPTKVIESSLDAKVDLQFLQPFIPGLEYGTGKVSVGLRLSGKPEKYRLLGNVILEDGIFRLSGLFDEFRSVQAQLSVSQDRINVVRFESIVNGGILNVGGDIKVDQFRSLVPNLTLSADKVALKMGEHLLGRFNGEFYIRGNKEPYLFGGTCRVIEGSLSSFDIKANEVAGEGTPTFNYDIKCEADDKLFVNVDVMNAEFKGKFHVLGDSNRIGLLGSAESLRGFILFREKKFMLNSGDVRFESKSRIALRFNVSGQAIVQESRAQIPQEYTVNLLAFGAPEDYKIRLTSSPALAEADIISLLLLGVTSRSQEGNYVDLGTTLVGQVPIQSKLESKLGVDIKLGSQVRTVQPTEQDDTSVTQQQAGSVPVVKLQKQVGERTSLFGSITLEEPTQRELKVEHALSDKFTVNGSVVDKRSSTSETQTVQEYGLDFRYRFQFE